MANVFVGGYAAMKNSTDVTSYKFATLTTGTTNVVLTDVGFSSGCYINNETGTTTANLLSNGLSVLTGYSTNGQKYTLSAPYVGAEKTLVLKTTAVADTTGVPVNIYSGSTATFFRDASTAYKEMLYINMLPPYACARLVGISTAEWMVMGTYGRVQVSTAVTFTT